MIEVVRFFGDSSEEMKLPFKTWKFPTGEVGFKFDENISNFISNQYYYDIVLKFESNDDIFLAFQAVDALIGLGVARKNIYLTIPYLPYSRQDRICHKGESFSLAVFASMLNTLGVKVITEDPHSYVTNNLIDKLYTYDQDTCAISLPNFDNLIAPDKGAKEKASKHLQVEMGNTNLIQLDKQRIGSVIKYMDYEFNTIKGSACIVDDICDGGGTFLACAEMLRRTQPNLTDLSLYVTHGFFTAGIEKLKAVFKDIYVHNLMSKDESVINFVKEI